MSILDLSKIRYNAKIPKKILDNIPPRIAKAPVEHSINGPTYSADEFRPQYWDEVAMPSEYKPKK